MKSMVNNAEPRYCYSFLPVYADLLRDGQLGRAFLYVGIPYVGVYATPRVYFFLVLEINGQPCMFLYSSMVRERRFACINRDSGRWDRGCLIEEYRKFSGYRIAAISLMFFPCPPSPASCLFSYLSERGVRGRGQKNVECGREGSIGISNRWLVAGWLKCWWVGYQTTKRRSRYVRSFPITTGHQQRTHSPPTPPLLLLSPNSRILHWGKATPNRIAPQPSNPKPKHVCRSISIDR